MFKSFKSNNYEKIVKGIYRIYEMDKLLSSFYIFTMSFHYINDNGG